MKNRFIQTIGLIGIVFSIYLILMDLIFPGHCPLFFGIPACYLVLLSFLLVFISTFLKKNNALIFYIGSISGLLIAIWFSYNQLFDLQDCPRFLNIPLCYVSFFSFLVLLIIHKKTSSKDF